MSGVAATRWKKLWFPWCPLLFVQAQLSASNMSFLTTARKHPTKGFQGRCVILFECCSVNCKCRINYIYIYVYIYAVMSHSILRHCMMHVYIHNYIYTHVHHIIHIYICRDRNESYVVSTPPQKKFFGSRTKGRKVADSHRSWISPGRQLQRAIHKWCLSHPPEQY